MVRSSLRLFVFTLFSFGIPAMISSESVRDSHVQVASTQLHLALQNEKPLPKEFLIERNAQSIPMEQLKAFAETYWQIKQSYVDKVEDKKLLEGAIHGMLQSLDPYSGYLNEDDLMDLQSSTDGMYDGLGVEVVAKNKQVLVVKTLADSPAERAGIKAEDVITVINSERVAHIGAEKAINSMRGKAGESIALTIERKGVAQPIELQLTRETLVMRSVQVTSLKNGFLHVQLSVFQRDTGYEMERLLRKYLERQQVKGIVLDLRDNPGGVLRAAVDVADLILPEGMIVFTEGRTSESLQKYYANPGDELEQIPLVVLINGGSASASEIVAGAIQDHQRAKLVGTKSFGKGLVQSIVPIRHNAAIKLTTSRYYTPSGRSIHGTGILPDLVVDSDASSANLAAGKPSNAGQDHQLMRAISLLEQESQRKL